MILKNPYRIGDLVKVKSLETPCQLPEGLPEGAKVKVTRKEARIHWVEHQGKEYPVPKLCVFNGYTELPDGLSEKELRVFIETNWPGAIQW